MLHSDMMDKFINTLKDWENLIDENINSFEKEFCHGALLHDVFWNFDTIKVRIDLHDELISDSYMITKWFTWMESLKK